MIIVDGETLYLFDPTSKPSKGINDHYSATVEFFSLIVLPRYYAQVYLEESL